MKAEIEWIRSDDAFASLAGEWDSLSSGSPFDLHCWYSAWWSAFGSGAELSVCTLRQDGDLVGVFPLWRSGRRLSAMANVHTPTYRPLARDPVALESLITAVMAAGGLDLCGLPADDGLVGGLAQGARGGSLSPLVERSYRSPMVETSGEFDAWRAESKKRWGAPLERFRRKMHREFEAEFSILEPPQDLRGELADGLRLEAAGWKGQQGTAIISDPRTEAFYTAVAEAFAGRGELRFSRITLDGITAGFDFNLLHGGRLYLLKTAFNEDFRKLAPGLVMRLSIIERCFELELRSHELLGDESEWKSKFATDIRPHVSFGAYSHRPAGLALYGYRRHLRPRLKRVYRRIRPPAGRPRGLTRVRPASGNVPNRNFYDDTLEGA